MKKAVYGYIPKDFDIEPTIVEACARLQYKIYSKKQKNFLKVKIKIEVENLED